jgi:hypothetical protein
LTTFVQSKGGFKMKKYLGFAAVCLMLAVASFVVAEQGDYTTLGFNTAGGYSYWRVDSSGFLKPGAASTYDIGTAALPVKTIYVGTISGAAISSGGAISGTTGTFTGLVSAKVGVSVSSSTSSSYSCKFHGAYVTLVTTANECDTAYQTSDHKMYVATAAVTATANSWVAMH